MGESNKHAETKPIRIFLGRKEVAKIFSVLLLSTLYFLFSASSAQAATLYLSPNSSSFTVGQTFSASVFVSSPIQPMNAADALISFPRDKLEVVSLSKGGSIFSLWVSEPSFSNSAGNIRFEGVIFNPGFIGSGGKILNITFRAKSAGNAPVSFLSGSVLANDGNGTNILASLSGANYLLSPSGQEAAPVEPEPVGEVPEPAPEEAIPLEGKVPAAPKINSPTHPDPNKWYSVNDTKFTWSLPEGVNSSRVLYGRNPESSPTVIYTPAIDLKEINDLGEGLWYFHVQLRNQNGWGGISHFRFQIDTQKPETFDIKEVERVDLTDPQVKFVFAAYDVTSGIDHYEISIDGGASEIWKDNGSHTYGTPVLGPGSHTLAVKVFDKAGNFLEQSQEFTVNALRAPTITEYPRKLESGDVLTIKGKSDYPNTQIVLSLQRENDNLRQYSGSSTNDGSFTFVINERLKNGLYNIWAEVVDGRGARSNPSERVVVVVERTALLKIGSFAVNVLAVLIPLIALVALLIFLLWYIWHKFTLLKRRFRKGVKEVEADTRGAFTALRRDVHRQVKALEKIKSKRQLTKEEHEILENLEQSLDKAEEIIVQGMDNIIEDVK